MGADHLFSVKTIETHARAFLPLNISAVCSVDILILVVEFQLFQVNLLIFIPSKLLDLKFKIIWLFCQFGLLLHTIISFH